MGEEKLLANTNAGWKPKSDCSICANTWSRLGSRRLSSYVSGYHQLSRAICTVMRANLVKRHGTMRYTPHMANVTTAMRILPHIIASGFATLVYVKNTIIMVSAR